MKWVRGATVGRGSSASVSLAITDGNFTAVAKSSPLSNSSLLKHEESVLRDLQNCPQIISCYGHGVTVEPDGEELFNLLLEYAPRGSLSGPLSESLIKRHTQSILKGLSFMHGKGYVHCDIKPQNILVDSDGNVKITDFGLAKRQKDKTECSVRGTPLYMSPESVAKREHEPAMDIWSLGCVVVEILTGRPAWGDSKSEDVWGLMMKIGFGDEAPEIPMDMSEEGKDFLKRCFVRDARKRWTADMLLKHPFASNLKGDAELGCYADSPKSVFSFGNCDESLPPSSLLFSCSYSDFCNASDRIKDLAVEDQLTCSWACESYDGWIRVRGENSPACSSSISAKERIRVLETGKLPDWCSSLLSEGWISARESCVSSRKAAEDLVKRSSHCKDEFCKYSNLINEYKKC